MGTMVYKTKVAENAEQMIRKLANNPTLRISEKQVEYGRHDIWLFGTLCHNVALYNTEFTLAWKEIEEGKEPHGEKETL